MIVKEYLIRIGRNKMGKKHSKMKENFRELKDDEVPEHIKKALGKVEKSDVQAISGRQRDFVNLQKDYHENYYNMAVIRAELEVMMDQVRLSKTNEQTMKWNGMQIPDTILKARTGKKNITYIGLIHYLEGVKKTLMNDGLTEEQIEIIGLEGKYIKDFPKLEINTGEAGK